ncbi:MAG: GTP-dependent dephospho-CoA kinase family protein [Halobacteria archaeon]|nr:GTP-dependent dephospho-CoA kinase family protein [Halobacteria archaeon]
MSSDDEEDWFEQALRESESESENEQVAEVEEERLNGRIVAVGDIVTYHLLRNDVLPAVSLVDGRTKRHEADEEVIDAWREIPERVSVENDPGTISSQLVRAIREALGSEESTRVEVDGEEDLGVIPAVLLADTGDTVVYGQPDEGTVYVSVNEDSKERCLELLRGMEGDVTEIEEIIGI